MTKLNAHEAKTRSEYLPRIEAGETIVPCRRNIPISEIRPLTTVESSRRPEIGFAKGTFTIPDEFLEALLTEFLDAFEGRND